MPFPVDTRSFEGFVEGVVKRPHILGLFPVFIRSQNILHDNFSCGDLLSDDYLCPVCATVHIARPSEPDSNRNQMILYIIQSPQLQIVIRTLSEIHTHKARHACSGDGSSLYRLLPGFKESTKLPQYGRAGDTIWATAKAHQDSLEKKDNM